MRCSPHVRDLAEVTHKPYMNSRQSQIHLFLAASIRSKESLSIFPATQDNLEPILLLHSVDQYQKQKDEILNITRNLPLCYLTTLPLFPPGHLTTLTHLFHLPSSLTSHFPTFPQLSTLPPFPAHHPPDNTQITPK